MPSFDTVCEVDMAEVKNAVLQARKELLNRFDFKGVNWDIVEEKNTLVLTADDDFKLQALNGILIGKLAKREISLKNIEHGKTEISSVGRARQVLTLKQGFETEVAKKIVADIRAQGLKVQAQIQEGKIRVSGKSRDDLQDVIGFLRGQELSVGVAFNNFRD
ncbi:MAG: YajQ family cyclic di-GMP-binding protein [Blastochloris sp.]|nr:YajQ family cyclic di-GMP-binding protein [Blastochloris sp.]